MGARRGESGVYVIVNVNNGKYYVGSSKNMRRRWAEHRRELNAGIHINPHLQNAWRLHGGERSFQHSAIIYCSEDELLFSEQRSLDALKAYDRETGYNIARFAEAPMRGRQHTEDAKRRMAESTKGYKHTPEAIAKMSAVQKALPISDEERQRRAARCHARTGRKITGEALENIRRAASARRGYRHSKEARSRMSKAQRGHAVSSEQRRKISERNTGYKHTDDAKAKIAVANIGRKHSKESRMKMSNGRGSLARETVLEIREMAEVGLPQREIAECYMISISMVSMIKTRGVYALVE